MTKEARDQTVQIGTFRGKVGGHIHYKSHNHQGRGSQGEGAQGKHSGHMGPKVTGPRESAQDAWELGRWDPRTVSWLLAPLSASWLEPHTGQGRKGQKRGGHKT